MKQVRSPIGVLLFAMTCKSSVRAVVTGVRHFSSGAHFGTGRGRERERERWTVKPSKQKLEEEERQKRKRGIERPCTAIDVAVEVRLFG